MNEQSYDEAVRILRKEIETADAVAVGAGAGLSTSAGLTYSGRRFDDNFADFSRKYGFTDMYDGGFYPYESPEEFWAYWSRYIYINRYGDIPGTVYADLLKLLEGKDWFVITTNVDHCFQRSGFDKSRLFYTQGDYGLFQCSKPCHNETYDNEDSIRGMMKQQQDMRIPSELVPRCPKCGRAMTMNLRSDTTFVEDDGWRRAAGRYNNFMHDHAGCHMLFLELGVGNNTPVIIKYPFRMMTADNRNAVYACINKGEASAPDGIADRSVCINEDISRVVTDLLK
jgi:NAD-dependent SIR2 family protein deacetylase